jgi:hypothetical protein
MRPPARAQILYAARRIAIAQPETRPHAIKGKIHRKTKIVPGLSRRRDRYSGFPIFVEFGLVFHGAIPGSNANIRIILGRLEKLIEAACEIWVQPSYM